jgi:hypothetical protein
MRTIIKIFCFNVIFFLVSCSSKPDASFAAYEMSKICSGQKTFFKSKGKFGTLSELRFEGLVVGDKRNYDDIEDGEVHGYVFEINTSPNGYLAKAKPKNASNENASFYVDNNSKNIKVAFDGKEANAESPEYQGEYDGQFACKE